MTALGGNSYSFTGSQAEIEALLASLTARPPLHSDADFTLAVTVTGSETNPTLPGGEVAVPIATHSFIVPVTVTAVADTPTVSVAGIAGDEDQAGGIVFGTGITGYATPDGDGSEYISEVRIGGFPSAEWVVTHAGDPAVTVSGDSVSGFTLTIARPGDAAALRAVLDSFTVQPPADSDADASVTVRVATTDRDGSTAVSAIANLPITVRAVADATNATGRSYTTLEDTAVPLTASPPPSAIALTDPSRMWSGSPGSTLIPGRP